MDDTIKLLEDRVTRVAARVSELAAERDRLEDDLRALRERLEQATPEADAESDTEREVWRSRKTQALEILREVVADLRG